MSLNSKQQMIHKRALALAEQQRKIEVEWISILNDVDRSKLYKRLNCRSLFVYATDILKLTAPIAYALIAVARKSVELPALARAIESKELSVFKAVRMTAVLDLNNAEKLIEFAKTHSSREIDFETAKYKPNLAKRPRARVVGVEQIEVRVTLSKQDYAKLQRVQSLLAQKQKGSNLDNAMIAAVDDYLSRHDPVKKAERAAAKGAVTKKPKPCSSKVLKITPSSRTPLTAEQKHAVHLRDGGRCTHQNVNGHRCGEDKWLHVHHIIPVSRGGTNDIENLTTLCSFHHDLVHQLSLPIEGQVTWLRSPRVRYG